MLLPDFFDQFPWPTPPLGCLHNRLSGLNESLLLEGQAAPPPWLPCLRWFVVCCGCSRDVTRPSYVKMVKKITLRKGQRRYFVPHIGLHHTFNCKSNLTSAIGDFSESRHLATASYVSRHNARAYEKRRRRRQRWRWQRQWKQQQQLRWHQWQQWQQRLCPLHSHQRIFYSAICSRWVDYLITLALVVPFAARSHCAVGPSAW